MLGRKLNILYVVLALAMISALSLKMPNSSYAAAILRYGDTFLGVNDEGHLNIFQEPGDSLPDGFTGPVGLYRDGVGDATSPGCLCEGWGVAVTRASGSREAGFANESAGSGGLTGGIFGADIPSATATSEINLSGAPVTVIHAYGPSIADDVFQAQVTIRNNSATETVSDVVYRRAMDWDIPPTEFSEFVTHQGVEANLESAGGNVRAASDNGFASSDPRMPQFPLDDSTENTDFIDNGPADHGSVFDFAFGDLAPGESRIFNIFYGSAANEADAQAAVDLLGVDVWSFGQSTLNLDSGDGGGDGLLGLDIGGIIAMLEDPPGSWDPVDPLDPRIMDLMTLYPDGIMPPEDLEPFLLSLDIDPAAEVEGEEWTILDMFFDWTSRYGDEVGWYETGDPANDLDTFLFAFGGVGGIEPGSDPEHPILPFVPAPGEFHFPAPTPRRWFDPPFDTYEYSLLGGDPLLAFTEVGAPPAGSAPGGGDYAPLTILIPDGMGGYTDVGTLGPGGSYLFGPDVMTFLLHGIDPELDTLDPGLPVLFPTFLDWDGTADELLMTALPGFTLPAPGPGPGPAPVPEPATMLLLGTGIIGLALFRRFR